MLFSEIIRDLSDGEFSQLGIIPVPGDQLATEQYEKVAGFVHLALLDLCARFNFLSNEKLLTRSDGGDPYRITEADFIRVEQVFVQDTDGLWQEQEINAPMATRYVSVSPFDTLTFVGEFTETAVKVRYRAKHEKLDLSGGPDVEIRIPEYARTALLYYVASRQQAGMMTANGEAGDSVNFKAAYEGEVAKLQWINPVNQERHSSSEQKFQMGGWV